MSLRQKDKSIKDTKGHFVLLKTHKLASALYVITNFLNDSDPIKWDLRDKALNLLSYIKSHDWDKSLSLIEHLVFLIEVVVANQYVSEMNFSLLKQEYQSLHQFIKQNFGLALSSTVSVKQLTPRPRVTPLAQPNNQENQGILSGERQRLILDFIKQQGGNWVSTKEIAATAPNLSLKTVQRDLLELVKAGRLEKTGVKRWSRYSASASASN